MKFIEGQNSPFMKAYYDKGRVKPILDSIPLFAVLGEDLGVRGALKRAHLEYDRYKEGKGMTRSWKRGGKTSTLVLWLQMAGVAAVGFAAGVVVGRRNKN